MYGHDYLNLHMCADHDAINCSTFAIWEIIMQTLKVTGIDWHKGRLSSKLYMDQSITLKLDQVETRRLTTGRGVRKRCCLLLIPFNLYSKYLTKEAPEVLGDFKIRGQVICAVKYGDDVVLLTATGHN
jgi:hypothetical protein